ncbi:MAG: type I restriction endonuclease subunit R [Thermoguttaceae bacterium]|nr:type I restriction endonuclease subunit R [Thermoguttaceae bacterium]
MLEHKLVINSSESTVMAKYERSPRRSDAYQTEAQLERSFIELLREQGYEYVPVKNREGLLANLRRQLEALNALVFTDAEWERLLKTEIAKPNEGIEEKTTKIQEDPVRPFTRDDGSLVNVKLIDRETIHNNKLQVINQYVENEGAYKNRYDVTVLVNGLPLVHVELKKRGGSLREAFNQIERYQRESFWADLGLYEYVQIFVISNGTQTKYYSNTTRRAAVKENGNRSSKTPRKTTSATFEFTSYWADETNEPIYDLIDFAKTFFARNTILNVLTRYCVFTVDKNLLVMRPYQIAATERILTRIITSTNQKRWSGPDAGGYIWHTTGSGKTLTSFKTAQLASRMPEIDKVLFVVDRKDLDYQTMREYDKFQKGAANGNKSAKILQLQLEDKDEKGRPKESRIIVTTIQKLQIFVSNFKKSGHPIFDKHVVLIFDECHRSQFGDMHRDIAKAFKKRHIFGFTGTPIFAKNASTGRCANFRTTEQVFGDKLHAYTIVDAIRDANVLEFHVDYVNTIKPKDDVDEDEEINPIDREKVMLAPERVANVVGYILEKFDAKTKRNEGYSISKLLNIEEIAKAKRDVEQTRTVVRLKGFNSIFATASVKAAKTYYNEFKKQLGDRFGTSLKVATIFSYAPNEDVSNDFTGGFDDENSDSADGLPPESREFLDGAIADYNAMFGTSYDTSAEKFANYYKDLSMRVKNREIDLLIVVNMFLTGFDAPTLNTLWVDKNLRMHGLLQAFSRTNRILNSVKKCGNIICFLPLQKAVEESIALFGDKDACGIVLMRPYDDYYYGYTDDEGNHVDGYVELVVEFQELFPVGTMPVGEKEEHDFIEKFGAILRLRNILTTFDEFSDPMLVGDMQDYTSVYNDLHDKYRVNVEKEDIVDDLVFEMELVKQVQFSIDYILALVAKYKEGHCDDKEILATIDKAVNSSPELRPKGDLIRAFIKTVTEETDVQEEWRQFVDDRKERELQQIIQEERLNPEKTREFIDNAFEVGTVETSGTQIDAFMPSSSRFSVGKDGETRQVKKERIVGKIKKFFERFFGV